MNRVVPFLAGVILAALAIFFIPGIKPCPDNGLSKIKIDSEKYLKFFGGPIERSDAIRFSDAYFNFLQTKIPDAGELNAVYTAGTYFTAEEIANYIAKVIKDNPGIPVDKIRLHFCTTRYPAGTTNPTNGVDVSGRLAATLVFFDASGTNPNTERPVQPGRLVYESAMFLGAYNWGDLMP